MADDLATLYDKLKEFQAAQRVENRKWQMKIDLVEIKIKKLLKNQK